jgi:hypothetical protein
MRCSISDSQWRSPPKKQLVEYFHDNFFPLPYAMVNWTCVGILQLHITATIYTTNYWASYGCILPDQLLNFLGGLKNSWPPSPPPLTFPQPPLTFPPPAPPPPSIVSYAISLSHDDEFRHFWVASNSR